MLGQLAASFGTRINTQNGLGLDLSNPPGKGAAIFNVASPRVMPADTNQRDASGISSAASAPASSMPRCCKPAATSSRPTAWAPTRSPASPTATRARWWTATASTASSSASRPPPRCRARLDRTGGRCANFRRVLDLPSGGAATPPRRVRARSTTPARSAWTASTPSTTSSTSPSRPSSSTLATPTRPTPPRSSTP